MLSFERFKNCDSEYRSAPFWSLNDELESSELVRQIRQMNEQGIGGFFMHPRGGMKTEYLSDKYFEAIRACCEEAKKLGMKAWIYDEDRFPSGGAGGFLTKDRPDLAQKALRIEKTVCSKVVKDDNILRVFTYKMIDGQPAEFEDITSLSAEELQGLDSLAVVFRRIINYPRELWNNQVYGDLCYDKAVEAFVETTHEKYKKEIGEYFGDTVPGSFTDEPNFNVQNREGNMLPWTFDFEKKFSARKGYDLLDHLPELFFDTGDYKKTRFDYWDMMTRLFVEAFSKTIYDWCEKNGLKFTGHYWEHGFPSPVHSGSTMPNYEYMQYPGIDMLFNTKHETEQYGNVLIVKEVSSVANQLDKKRVLSETYGASGWELDFNDQKKVADWQFALGINLVCQHLVHLSLKGYRKRDFPLSFMDHQPWWDTYKMLGDYIGRMSYAISQGSFVGDILVLHPYSSVWPEFSPQNSSEEIKKIGASAKWLTKALSELHFFYDLGDDIIMEKHGRVEGDKLIVGKMSYKTVILPHMNLMRSSSFKLLKEFSAKGGKIIATGATPYMLDGMESQELKDFFAGDKVIRIRPEKVTLKKLLKQYGNLHAELTDVNGADTSSIYCHKRQDGDKEILFLCNIDKENSLDIRLSLVDCNYVEEWNALTGEKTAISVHKDGDEAYLRLAFPPVGSHLLVIDRSKKATVIPEAPVADRNAKCIELNSWKIDRKDYNAMTLKFCKFSADDGEWSNVMDVLEADTKLVQKLGFGWRGQFAQQPWMYTPEEKAKKLKAKASFTFIVEEMPVGNLFAAVEAPEEFQVYVNGVKVEASENWYKDKAFVLHDIKNNVHPGENEIMLVNESYNIDSSLEAIYIVGDFRLRETEPYSYAIIKESEEILPGDWTKQGYPYYSGKMHYTAAFEVKDEARRAVITFDRLMMVSARVFVNGKEAGILGWKPYELDITPYVVKGDNTVTLEVMNSLQNLLGPHNGTNTVGIVSPGSFYAGAGDNWFVASGFSGKAEVKIF